MSANRDLAVGTGQDDRLARDFEQTLTDLEATRAFGKGRHQRRALGHAQKLLKRPGGPAILYAMAPRFDASGLFLGSDWDEPESLQPAMVRPTLLAGGDNGVLEGLSQLRMLAIATGTEVSDKLDAAAARDFLEQVLAGSIDLLFPTATEATRYDYADAAPRVQPLFQLILDRLGPGGILDALVEEVERVLLQRPIMVQRVESLLRAARRALDDVGEDDDTVARVRYWIGALYAPTPLARGKDADAYAAGLSALDDQALAAEAQAFGAAMDATGLVSAQHAGLLRYLAGNAPTHLASALALKAVGRVNLEQHAVLIGEIIEFAIRPQTARCIYGLSRLLEHGTLFFPPVAPGLRRLMRVPINPRVAQQLRAASEWSDPPDANVLLVAATLSVLGQPRGVDQGQNPTCQAARAISLWAQNDVGYLLELIAHAAREDEIVMFFEGTALRSREFEFGLATHLHTELDPVSLLMTPHLDRIYMEMSRRTIGRGGDGHRWVNPEFHGWWVYRGFAELIEATTGAVQNCDSFIRSFYAAYHPLYNGGRDVVYAQPCGVAVTDHNGAFVGWHAVAIQRVGCDPGGQWRVYFFNPNRDKDQNWGQGLVTSTHDHGEFEGESSLPFEQFASRLYVYHYKRRELGEPAEVPDDAVARIRAAIAASWAAEREWRDSN